MNFNDPGGESLAQFSAQLISTETLSPSNKPATVEVVIEAPVVIDVEGLDRFTLMCCPSEKRFLAAGFLFTEGVLSGLNDIDLIYECEDDPSVIRVKLAESAKPTGHVQRNMTVLSSCGACGTVDIDRRISESPAVGNSLHIDAGILKTASASIRQHQPLFERCGGTHWVGIFDADGELIACAEDAGRHNALDKAVGKCLFKGITLRGRWALLSGRISMEMVAKCARVGIELIAAISAPTSLAIEIAGKSGITLCAFVRETRATIFTHPERIIGLS